MNGEYASSRNPFLILTTVAVAFFLVLPLAILIVQSFTAEAHLSFPPAEFGARWYRYVATSGKWLDAAGRSLLVAAIVAPAALVIGTMAACGIDRGPRRGRAFLSALLISPMILPHVVLALGFFRLILMLNAEDSLPAIALAHLIVAVPYVVVTVGASLETVDPSLEEAARSLGASRWRAFRHVVVPAIMPGLVAGLIFAFIASFDEFIMTFFVVTFRITLPIQIFNALSFELEPSIAAVSTIALALTLLLTGLLMLRGQVVAGGRVVR